MNEAFGDRLRRLRTQRGETMDDVAAAIGVTRQSVGKYENENVTPGGVVLLRLSEHFGVSTKYLLCETDDATRSAEMPREVRDLVNEVIQHKMTIDEFREAIRVWKAIKEAQKREG